MLTVIGFTKLRGLFSLNGRVKPVLESNLGTFMFDSIGLGSYWPGATFILGSVVVSIPAILKRSHFETKPFPIPYVLKPWTFPFMTESAAAVIIE